MSKVMAWSGAEKAGLCTFRTVKLLIKQILAAALNAAVWCRTAYSLVKRHVRGGYNYKNERKRQRFGRRASFRWNRREQSGVPFPFFVCLFQAHIFRDCDLSKTVVAYVELPARHFVVLSTVFARAIL